MIEVLTLASVTGGLLAYWAVEARRHQQALARIPIRVHVNGTRGKSSVTRLIAAGLRAGGRRTCAKTTGTRARMIFPDGREVPVFRPARANVLEQIRVVRAAVEAGAEALVVECMALQPALQWRCEAQLVRSTHGVITNARPDHLDVMGPGPDDVARALAGTTPYGGTLYTSEQARRAVLAAAAQDRRSTLVALGDADAQAVTAAELAGFSYVAHAENVALALRVCADLGVPRATALAGMHAAAPDPGALREQASQRAGKPVLFVNAFAANDPESTLAIWQLARRRHPQADRALVVMNTRADRVDRSRQLGEAAPAWGADQILVTGDDAGTFLRAARQAGLPAEAALDLGGLSAAQALAALDGALGAHSLVVGVGNIGGLGFELVQALAAPEAQP